MQRSSGDSVEVLGRDELSRRYSLPVFTVSSSDFMKLAGIRTADGAAQVWEDVEGTEIPALRRYIHSSTMVRRKMLVRKQVIVRLLAWQCEFRWHVGRVAGCDVTKVLHVHSALPSPWVSKAISTSISNNVTQALPRFK